MPTRRKRLASSTMMEIQRSHHQEAREAEPLKTYPFWPGAARSGGSCAFSLQRARAPRVTDHARCDEKIGGVCELPFALCHALWGFWRRLAVPAIHIE